MRSIENENDPRILKELLKLAQSHIKYQDNLIKKIISEKDQVLQQQFSSEESLLILRKKLFGKSSEKSPRDEIDDFDRLRSADESELTLHSQNLVPMIFPQKNGHIFHAASAKWYSPEKTDTRFHAAFANCSNWIGVM